MEKKEKRMLKEIFDFRQSASDFREEEQKALKINIKEVNDIDEILSYDVTNTNRETHDLYLPDYDKGKILAYEIGKDQLNKIQSKFLTKLQFVLFNNIVENTERNQEKYIDELAAFLCDVFDLDDGKQLIMKPSDLKLRVQQEEFASHADREGIKNNRLIWVIQEDRHVLSTIYLHCDLQLVCSMIAAAQYNESFRSTYLEDYKILGLKFVADQLHFCSAIISKGYLKELVDGLPDKYEVTLIKHKGLKLSSPDDRSKMIEYFARLRKEALEMF